jgi:hypothetical protein
LIGINDFCAFLFEELINEWGQVGERGVKEFSKRKFATNHVHPNSRRESMFIEGILQFSLNPEGILCKNALF